MKKFIIFIFLIFLSLSSALSSPSLTTEGADYNLDVGQAVVISSRCDVYSEPSFSQDKKLVIDEKTVSLNHGDIVEIKQIEGKFALITVTQEVSGYVYKFYLTQNTSQTIYPVFNGSIRSDTKIYDADLKESGYTAKKDSRVYLYDGFDDKKKYTPVQIVLEDGSLYNGFIKTADINPDGISPVLIIGISIIVASVTIILSLIFIRKKKRK